MDYQEVEYVSSLDGSPQKALGYFAQDQQPRPLLVALHEWSSDYKQANLRKEYLEHCIKNRWHFIHPDFRGANNKPEATGSPKVISDILDCVDFVKQNYNVDNSSLMLLGVSGGGYTALMMLAKASQIWAAASVWVPVSDIKKWHEQCFNSPWVKYSRDIESSCGGVPVAGSEAMTEAIKRSPITYLKPLSGIAIDINAGINDGHTGSVPIDHSFCAFNKLAAEEDRICDEDILYFVKHRKVPVHLRGDFEDLAYGNKKVLFRKQSQNVRLTIFDGGHELLYNPVFEWLQMII